MGVSLGVGERGSNSFALKVSESRRGSGCVFFAPFIFRFGSLLLHAEHIFIALSLQSL